MRVIFWSILTGGVLFPVLLGITAVWLNGYRERKGLGQLPPNKLSLVILLLTLASWAITGFNIILYILK